MSTSRTTLLTSAISGDDPLSPAQCAYFRGRLRARMHEVILSVFLNRKKDGLTKAELSRRLGRAPEQVTRWLAAPGNLRLDTVSDLLLAMKYELDFSANPIETTLRTNHFHEMASIKPVVAKSSVSGASFRITRQSGADNITLAGSNQAEIH